MITSASVLRATGVLKGLLALAIFVGLLVCPALAGPATASRPAPTTAPVVAIVKGTDPDAMMAQAIELLGGLGDIVKDGRRVVIKPNLTVYSRRPHPGLTTDIRLVRAMIQCLNKTAKCKLTIAEGSGAAADIAFKGYGFDKLAKEFDVALVDLATDKVREIRIDGLGGQSYKLPETVLDSDVLIDMAVLKTHQITGVSLGMKNLFGLLPPPRWVHHDLADETLCDLVSIRKPDLVVIDGLVGMEGEGPLDGGAVPMDLIIVGRDVVAVDAVATTVMGFDPKAVRHIVLAAGKGLGQMDLDKIVIKGAAIEEVRKSFKQPTFPGTLVRLPKTDETVKKILALADRATDTKDYDRPVKIVSFKSDKLKVDTQKYPNRKSKGFRVFIYPDSDQLDFHVSFETLIPAHRQAALEEIKVWIKENLDLDVK